jgi:succinate dehydrogenase / fumarate reductase, cytochrome b subunit
MKTLDTKENYLGVKGWVWGGNFKAERYLYLLHRLTALGMILFLIVHLIITTVYRIQGQSLWDAAMAVLNMPAFKIGEFLVVVAFIFHALNGIRLILQELGIVMGKPTRPTFPFKDAVRRQRPLTAVFMALVVIIIIVFLVSFIVGGW